MNGNELTLQVRAELSDDNPCLAANTHYLIAIGLTRRGALEIEKASIPRRDLHAHISKARCPGGDTPQRVKWRLVASELRQKDAGASQSFHSTSSIQLSMAIQRWPA
jgi:hypothetical protein